MLSDELSKNGEFLVKYIRFPSMFRIHDGGGSGTSPMGVVHVCNVERLDFFFSKWKINPPDSNSGK